MAWNVLLLGYARGRVELDKPRQPSHVPDYESVIKAATPALDNLLRTSQARGSDLGNMAASSTPPIPQNPTNTFIQCCEFCREGLDGDEQRMIQEKICTGVTQPNSSPSRKPPPVVEVSTCYFGNDRGPCDEMTKLCRSAVGTFHTECLDSAVSS